MYTPYHRAEGRLLDRRRQMEEELGTYRAVGRYRTTAPKLYQWPTTPQLMEWASGANAGNRPGAFSRERLSRAGRSGLDPLSAVGRPRASSSLSSGSAMSIDSNRTRLSRGALSNRAARGLRATLWPQVEHEVRWLQGQFENDLRVTRMDFADHYEKMEHGLQNVSNHVMGLQRAVEGFTFRFAADAPGDRPIRFPEPVPNIFASPPRQPSSRQDAAEGDRLSLPRQTTRSPSPNIPGKFPRTVLDSTERTSPERTRARSTTPATLPPEPRTPPNDTRRVNPHSPTAETESEAGSDDTSNGSKRWRRLSDYVRADKQWEERRTGMSNAQQRNPFRESDQPPSPPTPAPNDAVYPLLPVLNVQPPSPQDKDDAAESGTQGEERRIALEGLGPQLPLPMEDDDCWRYWPNETKPPPRATGQPLSRPGASRQVNSLLTPEDSGSNTPAEGQTQTERIREYYTQLRSLVYSFCQNSRLVNLGPCKRGVTQSTLGARQFPFATSFPDAKAPGAMYHIFLPLPAVEPEKWNDYSKDQRWWIIMSGIMEILWGRILSEQGTNAILHTWRNKPKQFLDQVVDSIYYALRPVWNQWVLDDHNQVEKIKDDIRSIVQVARWLTWLAKNLDHDAGQPTIKERFVLFVPKADSAGRLRHWDSLFERRGEVDGMQNAMGENTRDLREQMQTSEELDLITGNPLYMFAFPALLKGKANQEIGEWEEGWVLERGWVIAKTITETSPPPPAPAVPVAPAATPAPVTPVKAPKTPMTSLAEAVANTLAATPPLTRGFPASASTAASAVVDKWDDGEGNVGEYSSWEPVAEDLSTWDDSGVFMSSGTPAAKEQEADLEWEEIGPTETEKQAAEEAEAREREVARQREMARRLAKGKEKEGRKSLEQKELERKAREEALAKKQREQKAAQVKKQLRREKKKEKKEKKERTVAQIAAENFARQKVSRRSSL